MTAHDDAMEEMRAALEEARLALEASIHAGDSHYAHFDRQGTAGANCPACQNRRTANGMAHNALVVIDSAAKALAQEKGEAT